MDDTNTPAKRGRKPGDEWMLPVHIKLPRDLFKQLEADAKRKMIPLATLIRMMLAEATSV